MQKKLRNIHNVLYANPKSKNTMTLCFAFSQLCNTKTTMCCVLFDIVVFYIRAELRVMKRWLLYIALLLLARASSSGFQCSPPVYLTHTHSVRVQVIGASLSSDYTIDVGHRETVMLKQNVPLSGGNVSVDTMYIDLDANALCETMYCVESGDRALVFGTYYLMNQSSSQQQLLVCEIDGFRMPRFHVELYWIGDAWDNLHESCRVQVLLESTLLDRAHPSSGLYLSAEAPLHERFGGDQYDSRQHWVLPLDLGSEHSTVQSVELVFREAQSTHARFVRHLSLETLHRTCLAEPAQHLQQQQMRPTFEVSCDVYESEAKQRRADNRFVDGEYVYTVCELSEPLDYAGRYALEVQDILLWEGDTRLVSLMTDEQHLYRGFEMLETSSASAFIGRWRARPLAHPELPLSVEFHWSVMPLRKRASDAHSYTGEHLALRIVCNASAVYNVESAQCERVLSSHKAPLAISAFISIAGLALVVFILAFVLQVWHD